MDQALRFHPDRLDDRSPDAIERAQFRMHEINDAWRVLRNPSARAHYDDVLRAQVEQSKVLQGASVSAGAAPRYGSTASSTARYRNMSAEPDDVAELAPEEWSAPSAPRSRWLTWGPVIIGGVVLVIVLIVAGAATSKSDSGVKVQTVEEFATGTCIRQVVDDSLATLVEGEQARPVIVSVPCTGTNEGQVVSRVNFPMSCPSGTRAVLLPTARESLCIMR